MDCILAARYQSGTVALPPIPFSPAEFQRLEHAESSPPDGLPAHKKRQLRILLALCRGESVSSIANAEELHEQRVRDIRAEAIKRTLTCEIDRLTAVPLKASAAKPEHRAHAGRPGHKRFDDRAAAFNADDEPIFELSTLLIFPDVQLASFSVRIGRLYDFKKQVKKANGENLDNGKLSRMDVRLLLATKDVARDVERAADEPVYWTEVSNLDDILAETFAILFRGLDRMQPPAEDYRVGCAPLGRRFDERFGHVILSSGPEVQVQKFVTELGNETIYRHVRVNPEIGFLSQLEAVLYQRRMKASSIGFMPAAWYVYDQINEWLGSGFKGPFVWQVGQSDIQTCVKRHAIISEYFAIFGALFEMSSFLWRKLLYEDDIPFATISHRTRVEVVNYWPDRNLVRLSIEPLPEYVYPVEVPCQAAPNDLAKVIRKRLNDDTPEARKMIYSTRSHGMDLRPSVHLPQQFFQNDNKVGTGDGFGVVLFPRHFLSHRPPVDLEQLVALAGNRDQDVWEETLSINSVDERCCIFYAPKVLVSISQGFEENRYGDGLRQLCELQGNLLKRSLDRETAEADSWIPHFLKTAPDMPTFYYFDEACLGREGHPPEVEARFAHFIRSNTVPDALRPPLDYRPRKRDHTHRQSTKETTELLWSYNEQFNNLLRNMDADFLIIGFDADTKAALVHLATRWESAIERILKVEYWPEEQLDIDEVIKVVGQKRMKRFFECENDVRIWVEQARLDFVRDSRYVVRSAVENMQRLVLGGYHPHPIFVETRSATLSRWKNFLGTILNTRLSGRENEIREEMNAMSSIEMFRRADLARNAEPEGVNEILEAINRALNVRPSRTALIFFYHCARDYEDEAWEQALDLENGASDPRLATRIRKAVTLCRNQKGVTERSAEIPPALEKTLKKILTPS